MNWLILLALVAVFVLQVADLLEYAVQQDIPARDTRPGTARTPARPEPSTQAPPPQPREIPGITGKLMLKGWSLQGLFGYMWLHGGLFHLLGNLLFLWVFGNAVCAKIGNLRYLLLYVLFGVLAGIVHLLFARGSVIGASGAIGGIVGMYLVLFYQNDITCVLVLVVYVRVFAVSSIWMILLWMCWNTIGALIPGSSSVAYFAHLGGFGAGFGIALLMCKNGWITMEKYERSLVQMWEERKREGQKEPVEATYAKLGLCPTDEGLQQETARSATPPQPEIMPPSPGAAATTSVRLGANGFIRTACPCGQSIRVTRQYAGRTVRCPRCRHPVVIPNSTDFFGPVPVLPPIMADKPEKTQDTHIRFICTCGKRMKAPAQYAGRTVKCPRCGMSLKIPTLLR
jgi:membrane associated rhomboid family serine protease/DNA-directed RNA polymerase subunit RPC12/RpoP